MFAPSTQKLLLAVLCLAAVAISGCTAAAEQEAFRKIKDKGGKIELKGRGPQVSFAHLNITDDDLACVEGLPHLHELSLENVEITDKGLEHLLPIGQFDSLRIRQTKITDEGINKLKQRFPKLEVRDN